MKRWPDGTIKSQGNAFDWKRTAKGIKFLPQQQQNVLTSKKQAEKAKTFTVYSKAKSVKLAYAGNE